MYEPTYAPKLEDGSALLSGVRFGINHVKEFVKADDPAAEPAHIHEYAEVFFNLDSEVSFLINNNLYPVKKGSAVVSRANDVHVCLYNETCVQEYFCLWIDAPEDSPILSFLNTPAFYPLLSFDETTSKALKALFFSLEEACETGDELQRTSLFLQLLVRLKEREDVCPAEEALPPVLQKILDDINENFATIHHVGELLDTHFISSATLNRYFRKYIRLSPRAFLESKKLSHAAMLLSKGESVTEACMQSGFSDCSHFIVLFKKKFGKTPLKYKQRFEE